MAASIPNLYYHWLELNYIGWGVKCKSLKL